MIDGLLGWFFRGFNKVFAWSSNAYGKTRRAAHAPRGHRADLSTSACSS